MENELIDGLLRGNLVGGLAIIALLLGRQPLRRLFGPALIYRFWLLPPLLAAASLLPLPRDGLWQALPVVLSPAADWPRAAAISAWTGPGVLIGAWGLGGAACALVLGLRQARFAAALGVLQPVGDGGGAVWRAAHSNLGPALVGRAIVVPADFEARFTAEEQAAILAHERTHLARGDVLANALVALAQCLCWFNPAGPSRRRRGADRPGVVLRRRGDHRAARAEAELRLGAVEDPDFTAGSADRLHLAAARPASPEGADRSC